MPTSTAARAATREPMHPMSPVRALPHTRVTTENLQVGRARAAAAALGLEPALFGPHNMPFAPGAMLSDLELSIIAVANESHREMRHAGGGVVELDARELMRRCHEDSIANLVLALRTLQQRKAIVYQFLASSGRIAVLIAPWAYSAALSLRVGALIGDGAMDATDALDLNDAESAAA